MKPSLPIFVASFAGLGYAVLGVPPTPTAKAQVSFDRDIMPILGQKCFKCHGPDVAKAAAGLRLDSFTGATTKLYDGKAIVPGDVEKSLMLKRVNAPNLGMRMPPPDSGVKPLSPDQIQTLTTWIKQGAKYEKHWSYVPPSLPPMPKVRNAAWCKNPIDRLVLAKLESEGFQPEVEADRDTLAMRASETLTGLPPRKDILDSYRKDTKPGAYERYVDRLMDQPTYGEHQARYWLDAVRYADTHGLQLDNERGIYPYRDWVVRAYNMDLPFDKFVVDQLAGDLLPNPTTEDRIATGYVRANLTSNEGGAIEEEFLARNTFDRVDTTSTIFLGLTVQCAKCHDHKFDPIKQKDYYGLYAFFNSTKDNPLDGNVLLPPPVVRAETDEEAKEIALIQEKMNRARSTVAIKQATDALTKNQSHPPETSHWQISQVSSAANFDEAFEKPFPGEPGYKVPGAWKAFTFQPDKNYAGVIGKDNSAVYVSGILTFSTATTYSFGVSSDDAVKVWLNGKLIHSNKTSRGVDQAIDKVQGDFRAGNNELVVKIINGSGPDGLNIHLVGDLQARIAQAISDLAKAPLSIRLQNVVKDLYFSTHSGSDPAKAFLSLEKQKKAIEDSIPMSLVAEEMPKPRPTFILKRGLYDQKGDSVERHIPPAIGSLPSGVKADRLSFAKWLISPQNPLVARVYVNRMWQQNFGCGIVKTSEDFGSQGEWPINQPLLDYLAVSFREGGWSTKKLNRMIVTSATFRQSSRVSAVKLTKDPENRLLSRGPRYRLDAEVIRDKALMAGGLLLEKLGGRGFKPYQPDGLWEGASDPASETHFYVKDKDQSIYRRSMYLFWKRTSPPPVMLTFDAPLRDTCTVRRSTTNTPLQALATMNEPAFLEASRTMASRLLQSKDDDNSKIRRAFEIALGRIPRPGEISVLQKALVHFRQKYSKDVKSARALVSVGDSPQPKSMNTSEQACWMLVCSTLMNTDEFLTLH